LYKIYVGVLNSQNTFSGINLEDTYLKHREFNKPLYILYTFIIWDHLYHIFKFKLSVLLHNFLPLQKHYRDICNPLFCNTPYQDYVQGVPTIYAHLSPKKCCSSLENQYFWTVQKTKYWFSGELWPFFWDRCSEFCSTLCNYLIMYDLLIKKYLNFHRPSYLSI